MTQTEAGWHLCQAWSHLVGATMSAETGRHSCGDRESVTQAEADAHEVGLEPLKEAGARQVGWVGQSLRDPGMGCTMLV